MRTGGDEDRAIYLAQAALEYNQLALVLEPGNEGRKREMAGSHAWLADAWLGVCNLDNANQARSEGVSILEGILEANPDDTELLIDLSHAKGGLAYVQSRLGMMGVAETNLRASASLLERVIELSKDQYGFDWDRLVRLGSLGMMMLHTGRAQEARRLISDSTRLMAEQYESGDKSSFEKTMEVATALGQQSSLAMEMENMDEARKLNQEAIRILLEVVSNSPGFVRGQTAFAHALINYWQLNEKLPPPEWLVKMEDYSLSDRSVRSCDLADLAVRQAVMRGDLATAESYKEYLLGKGYREPDFIRFCEANGLFD
jgi:tetratricopeptide (TPR) repeat protein